MQNAQLPDTGFISRDFLIGRPEVTAEQAEENRKKYLEYLSLGRAFNKPRRPRHGIVGLLPGGNTWLYEKIKTGEIPPPVKFGRKSMWRVEDVRKLLAKIGGQQEQTTAAA